MHKKILTLTLFLIIFVVPVALAVGGGGGGGGGSSGGGGGAVVPACTEDTWNCGDWSLCSIDGKQIRSCTMTLDCATANTPKPTEEQACEAPKKAPTCLEDVWECGDWTPSCNILGRHTRVCQKTFECESIVTNSPPTEKSCEKLQCGDKKKIRDRISCRLNLAPEGIDRELEIQYLPEECRVLRSKISQASCIARYKLFRPCWYIPAGEDRFVCARVALTLGPGLSDEVRNCSLIKTYRERSSCLNILRQKEYSMIKFRIYDLEERAEDLALERGLDLDTIADLVTTIELKKQEFNNARTKTRRRKIILDVRKAWEKFIKATNLKEEANDKLDQALIDLNLVD